MNDIERKMPMLSKVIIFSFLFMVGPGISFSEEIYIYGHTDTGKYISGSIEIEEGRVEGELEIEHGGSLYIEGETIDESTLYIEEDDSSGGNYELDYE